MGEDDDDFIPRLTARSAAANYNKNITNHAGSGALALFLMETWALIAENVEESTILNYRLVCSTLAKSAH